MAAVDRVKAAAAELVGRNLSLGAALEEVCGQKTVASTILSIIDLILRSWQACLDDAGSSASYKGELQAVTCW